jgi:hypothetical protein
MSAFGQQPSDEAANLASQHQATWSAYNALQPTPGWQQRSIDAATAAARAKFELDRANGYTR